MNILLINQPLNNRGDESAHKGLIRKIVSEVPNAKVRVLFVGANQNSIDQFKVVDNNIDYININPCRGFFRFGKISLEFSLLFLWLFHPTINKVIKIYKESDIVMCAPGGICMGGFQSWPHLFFLHIAKYAKKPLVYYGRSFGPFPTSSNSEKRFKKLSLDIINYFSFLSIRDSKTAELADSLGVQYAKTVDSAFLDSPKVPLPKQLIFGDYIVFVPNLLIWHYAYKGRIAKETVISFYKQMLDTIFKEYPSYKVVMLPQTFNYGTYEGDDIHFFRDIVAECQDGRIVVVSDTYSSDIQQTIISKSKMMIGARYHSVVFAINNNVPFIALSYEHKIAGLLHTLGKDDCMIDITSALDSEENITNTIEHFSTMIANRSDDKQVMLHAKEIAANCFSKLVAQTLVGK